MILGLDISTAIVGVATLEDRQLILSDHWDISKAGTLFEKAELIGAELWQLRDCGIEHIFIETALKKFIPGRSRADTIMKLAKFNGIVSWMCYSIWNIKPEHISAIAARRSCGIKVPRGEKTKEIVLNFLLDSEDGFVVEYTKHGNPKAGSFDRADSIVIARAGYNTWKERNSES